MSAHIADERSEWPLDQLARCKRDHLKSYVGTRRAPQRPDEKGAELVIDCVGGGRLLFVPEPSAPRQWFRIRELRP